MNHKTNGTKKSRAFSVGWLMCLATLLLLCVCPVQAQFVTQSGTVFKYNGRTITLYGSTFYAGVNTCGGPSGTSAWYDSSFHCLVDHLISYETNGNQNIMRPTDFFDSSHQNMTDSTLWGNMDYLIAQCKSNGLFVLLDLSAWKKVLTAQGLDIEVANNWYALIDFAANRYKNEPTIAFWSINGEPSVPTTQADSDKLVTFYSNATARLRSDDPNHLITAGGFNHMADMYNNFNTLQRIFSLPNNNVCCYKVYSQNDINFIPTVTSYCVSINKISFNQEFGMPQSSGDCSFTGTCFNSICTDRPDFYRNVYNDGAAGGTAGFVFWNLGDQVAGTSYEVSPSFSCLWSVIQQFGPGELQQGSPPSPPTNLSATGGNGQVSLTWTGSSGATNYNVKRSSSSSGPYTTIATGVTSTSYTDTGLSGGTTYYYVVTAVNGNGESGNSNYSGALTVPSAPTSLSASGGSGQISLTWNASTGAASYNVKRSTTSGGPCTTVASGVSSTSYTDTGLAAGTTYYYVVTAVNGTGESGNSGQASAITIPAAPTGLSATAGNSQASLSWTGSTGAANYNVKRSTTSGGPYTTITNVSSTSFVNTGLANGTTYSYVVSALDASGESGNSSQVSATPSGGGGAARALSINFVGNGSSMGSSESAGVVAKANWNNALGPTGSGQSLNDETGASSGATLTWSADHNSSQGITDTPGNYRMMNGHVNTSNTSTVTVSGLASSTNGWDVYVYCQENITSTRVGACTISGTGITTTTVQETEVTGGFTGTFTQASNSIGNYIKFSIGNVSGFTMKSTPVSSTDSSKRAPINGIQVIPRGSAPPSAPPPISIDFVGSGTSMASTETAGVIATNNWNVALGPSGAGQALNDATGAASGATLTWTADHNSSDGTNNAPGNFRMIQGLINTATNTTTTVTVTNLPTDSNGYKVYVYCTENTFGATRVAAYKISGTGITTTTIDATDPGSFSGTFTQANNSTGNYVVFTIGNVSAFTVSATPVSASDGTLRAPLNGIQVIPQ